MEFLKRRGDIFTISGRGVLLEVSVRDKAIQFGPECKNESKARANGEC